MPKPRVIDYSHRRGVINSEMLISPMMQHQPLMGDKLRRHQLAILRALDS